MIFREHLSFFLLFLFFWNYTCVTGSAAPVTNESFGGLKTLKSFSDSSDSVSKALQEEIYQELNHLSLRKQREIFEGLEKQEKELSKKSLVRLETENLSPLNVEELKNVKKTIKTTNTTLPAIRNKRTLNFLLQAVARAMGYTLTPRNSDAEWIPRQRPQPPQQPSPAPTAPCPTTPPPCRPASPSPPPCPMPPTTPPCPASMALMQIPTIPPSQIDANTISYPYRPARTIPLLNFAPLPQGVSVPYPALLQRPSQPPCSPPQTPPPCGTTPAPRSPPCGATPAPAQPPCGVTPAPSPSPCQTTPAPKSPPCQTAPSPQTPSCGGTPAPPPPCGTTPAPRRPQPCGATPTSAPPSCTTSAPSPSPCATTPRPTPPPCQTTPAPSPPCGATPAPTSPPCATTAPKMPPPCAPPQQPSQPPCAAPTQAPAPTAPPCGAPAPPPSPPPSQKPTSPPSPPSGKPKKGSILLEYDDPVRIHIFSNNKKYLPASGSIYHGHDDGYEEEPHSYFFPTKTKKKKDDVEEEEEEEVEEEHVESQEESDEEERQKQEETDNDRLSYYEREDEKSNQTEKQEAEEEEEDESETNLSVVRKPVSKEIQKNHQRRLVSLKSKNIYGKGHENDKEDNIMEEKMLEKTEKMATIKKPKRKKWVRIVKKQRRKSKTDSTPHENYHVYTSDNSPESSENLQNIYTRGPVRVPQITNQDSNSQDTEIHREIQLKKFSMNNKTVSPPELIREVRRYEGYPRYHQTRENDEVRRKQLEKAVERYVEDYVEKQLGEELLKNTGVPKTTIFEFAPKNGPRIQTITRTVAKTSGNPSALRSQFAPVVVDTESRFGQRGNGNGSIPRSNFEENFRRRGEIVNYKDFATRSKK